MSSDQKSPEPHDKNTRRPSASKLSLSELIAQTPGAQPREQLLERIKGRRQKHTNKPRKSSSSEEQFSTPEPLPMIDDPKYLGGFLKRFIAKEQEKRTPPKRSTPYLIVDNDKRDPPDKE